MRERKLRIDTCGDPMIVQVATVAHQSTRVYLRHINNENGRGELFLGNSSPDRSAFDKIFLSENSIYTMMECA